MKLKNVDTSAVRSKKAGDFSALISVWRKV